MRLLTTTVLLLSFTASGFLVWQAPVRAANLGIGVPVSVTLVVGGTTKYVQSSANDVGALLEEQGVMLGKNDVVYPSLADRVTPHQTIRVMRVIQWVQTERQPIAPQTIQHFVFSLPSGHMKVLSRGRAGVREALVRYEQRDDAHLTSSIVGQNILIKARPRIIAVGTTEYASFLQLEQRGLDQIAYVALRTLRMVATAYTAGCAGCSGITASGRRAGHGIVAVDPHYIPLGTHLYIPGYGIAIAGDTGGAIRGNRIDLGFNSYGDAVQFGRRAIVVYQLK